MSETRVTFTRHGMLRGARINAEWMDAPTAADVRLKDQERLIEKLLMVTDRGLRIVQRLILPCQVQASG